jgi:glycosyltransferase involved in cell wall biosynthesis
MVDTPAAPSELRYSLVIPAHNEERLLPRLLESVEVARRAYPHGRDAVEVIVADNASTDATAEIARRAGCRVVRVEKRVIAASRNGGAAAARASRLAFIDADSTIHPRTFSAIDAALDRDDVVAGATGVRLERWSLPLAVTYALIVPLVALVGIDTGVVFCRRADFEAIGGYDESRLFAEDVAFLWSLRRLGRTRRQRLFRATSAKATTSMRKYDKHGDWHFLTSLVRVALAEWRRPGSADAFARRYWYEDR